MVIWVHLPLSKHDEKSTVCVLAEAEVPRAIAEAFENRKLGLMDYYELKNVQADTEMRQTIAGHSGGDKS